MSAFLSILTGKTTVANKEEKDQFSNCQRADLAFVPSTKKNSYLFFLFCGSFIKYFILNFTVIHIPR